MKEKKSFLIEALVRQAMVYAEMKTDEAAQKFDATLERLKSWVDIEGSDKYASLVIFCECRAERYGNALKLINKLVGKEMKDDAIRPLTKSGLLEKRAQIFEKLGYSILVEYDKSTRIVACPKSYALF